MLWGWSFLRLGNNPFFSNVHAALLEIEVIAFLSLSLMKRSITTVWLVIVHLLSPPFAFDVLIIRVFEQRK